MGPCPLRKGESQPERQPGIPLHFRPEVSLVAVNAVFFAMTTSMQLVFLQVSSGWRGLLRHVARVEATFLQAYGQPQRLRLRMLAVTTAAFGMALGESLNLLLLASMGRSAKSVEFVS